MRIMIVEDEALVAERITRLSKEILGNDLTTISTRSSLDEAIIYLESHCIDLLLLDLNLNGKDGFKLLERAVSESFHTIIVSANTDQAIRAFEYGVLDFVGKPFTISRLKQAFTKFSEIERNNQNFAKYLSVRKNEAIVLLSIEKIEFIQGDGIYADIHLRGGGSELHSKSLSRLESILPPHFFRVHKSYIVNLRCVSEIRNVGDNKYELELASGTSLPVSRTKFKTLKESGFER